MKHLTLDPSKRIPLLREDAKGGLVQERKPPEPKSIKGRYGPASGSGAEDASVFFIGTATTILEWQGIRILTDPNFLHAGDHVHLGPGVTAERLTNPAVDLHDLPPLDVILLSHYHADHFDQLVEKSLHRDFPIITTPHAKGCLTSSEYKTEDDGGPFRAIHALDAFASMMLDIPDGQGPNEGEETSEGNENRGEKGEKKKRKTRIKITGMPGKHVPPGPLSIVNDLLGAVPPTNGWMLELGYGPGEKGGEEEGEEEEGEEQESEDDTAKTGYRIYISGDTLFVDELKKIPEWLKQQRVDLMLLHLGGTTIPSPKMPLLMVTMDAEQGLRLMRLVDPDVTIPIHYDDYDMFLTPLDDFKKVIEEGKLEDKVVYLDRGEQFRFKVRGGLSASPSSVL
ncbi:Metallo-hydrolase/oxidoreductase [Sodiomyces alkalinus F11]|uniref:Metallo-hydrolase/oxidoreductase n=1 Tax=Sodiomyces alkalinus (strain CBS 110278 / VKM F-3762 / F11) TaxID=1314773 RepID=A0A3N2PPH3_SODAK|nr:Metallo-hydrolase/oxidoreductase [Sodiomyces alkalinus F11]ROT36409.1 Metallo-hydrolase/oxidoreductase [Sodiomyces alkalinus F11]